ncbi:Putative disease resistance RPP13-like protein [Arachis hypogaea]|nr:Putative disease resistance RPP13-like protein [Arachis hypogaea]
MPITEYLQALLQYCSLCYILKIQSFVAAVCCDHHTMAEALVAGAFLSGFINVVFDRLISSEFVNLVVGKKLDRKLVEKLKTALLAAEALVADAEQKQFGNELVRKWLDSLRDALYTADDLLDRVCTKAEIRSKATTTHHDSCVDHLAYAFGCWKHLRVQLHHEFNSKFIEGIIKLD